MANIDKELNKIKNATFGREVRSSIHDGIKAINNEVEITTSEWAEKVENGDFNATIDVGKVVTGEPGTEVVVENVGSNAHAILDFQIPKGDPGRIENATAKDIATSSGNNVQAELNDVQEELNNVQLGLKNMQTDINTITTNEPVVLFDDPSASSSYSKTITTLDNIYNYKRLLFVFPANKTVVWYIINNQVYEHATAHDYRNYVCHFTSFNTANRSLVLSTALWTSMSVNEGTRLLKVIGFKM